jgi:hypothetical protein
MAVTDNITNPDRHAGSSVARSSAITVALVAILAVSTLALAWPRLQAALTFLPVEAAIERYYLDHQPPYAALDDLIARATRSAMLQPQQRYWSGLVLLHYLQANDATRPLYAQRESYEAAAAAADASLALAPVQPRTWLYRSLALGWLSFRDTGLADSFKASVYTGRVEPALLLTRLRLGYARLGQLDAEARGLLRDQTLLAWRLRERDFSVALRRGELDLRRVAVVLTPADAPLLQQMEDAVAGRVR